MTNLNTNRSYNYDEKQVFRGEKQYKIMIKVASAGVLLSALTNAASQWSYINQPSQKFWSEYADTCGGVRQSPIDIKTAEATKASVEDDVDAPGIIQEINSMTFSAKMSDPSDPTSHAIKFTPSGEKAANGKVKCEQFHFHMNTSEHTIDGKAYRRC